jgi:hypothetical protein
MREASNGRWREGKKYNDHAHASRGKRKLRRAL